MTQEERYDRQLRLWGSHGQKKLSSAKILCLGSSIPVVEALKNLVLPGIGSFDIVDETVVTDRDLGKNFFVACRENIGRNRAVVVTENLLKLNPSCTGQGIQSLSLLSPECTTNYIVCLISRDFQLLHASNELLKEILSNIPFIVHVESIGFLGRVRLVYNTPHVILEPKAEEGRIDDFRISNPWNELSNFSDQLLNAAKTDIDMCHIPYLILLIKAVSRMSSSPTRQGIVNELMTIGGKNFHEGLNFKEALDNIYRVTAVCSDRDVVDHLEDLIELLSGEERGSLLNSQCANILQGIVRFFHTHGVLPLSGVSLPDMSSYTESYTKLGKIFRSKWVSDMDTLRRLISVNVDESVLGMIVSNIRNISIMPKSSLRMNESICVDEFEDPEHFDVVRVLDGRLGEVENIKFVEEITRYKNACELHAVGSVVGSVAAQEIVKLVTNQFVPINDSFVFNGINGTSFTYRT
jgi:amyloid beta precursor protein binding protein 1